MRSYQKEILYFIVIALVAFGAFYVCGNFFKAPHHNQIDAHVWLHEQIGITAEQDQKLSEIEKNFAEKQKVLREKIHVGNLELAAAMLEDKAFSERVAAAVERIHLMEHEGEKFDLAMVYRGTSERIIPVLMTALTASLALIPLVIAADEPGRELLHPVAVVIFCGLFSSTLLDLTVRPLMFWKFGKKPIATLLPQAITQ